jgi:ATP-dependent DNA helicase RecG
VISESNLKELINEGESKTIEFKEKFDRKAMETAGALANSSGGLILVGINRHGKAVGTTTSKETEKDWANRISHVSEPTLIPDVQTIEIEKKMVVILSIKEFPQKPVSIHGRFYRRVGASNRVMTPSEISEMHMYSMGMTWDATVHPHDNLEDIELQKVKEYVKRTKETGRRKFQNDKTTVLLNKLDLTLGRKPTWAAAIAFGKIPPIQAKVKCGKIRGTSTIIDDFVVDSPLLDQVDEVINYMRRVFQLSYSFAGKAKRDEIWEYPLEAVREAVTNAICHRDYSSPAQTQIKIFDDRLVIWNPGGLPSGMTIEKLMDPNHNSVPRNKLIALLFYDVGLIENYGSGIKKILNECNRLRFPAPEFEDTQGGFQVIFRKDIYTEEYLTEIGLNERQIKAMLYVKEKGKITNKEYRNISGVTDRTVLFDLKDLCNRDLLIKVGKTGRDTKYILKKNKPEINPK